MVTQKEMPCRIRLATVRHERDERRDDDRERADPVIAGQRRQLIAERLAGTGWKDSETEDFASAVATMVSCRERPSSPAGFGRNPSKPNHCSRRPAGSLQERHHTQAGSVQDVSRSRRTSVPALGNW